MSKFIMLVGLPGSGKSTWAKQEALNRGYALLSSDSIRNTVFQDENDQTHNGIIFELMKNNTLTLLKNDVDVIYDATNINRKRRKALLKQIKANVRDVECFCFVFTAPFEVLVQRREISDRKVPKEVILNMMKSFQVPHHSEGFDHIRLIDSSTETEKQHWREQIESVLQTTKHDNPHHKEGETLWDHCAECSMHLANMSNSEFTTEIYIELGRMHDYGKAYTKVFDEEGIAHYHGHANVSGYIALTLKKDINFALIEELHMMHYNENYEKYLEQFPGWITELLSKLNQADMTCSRTDIKK